MPRAAFDALPSSARLWIFATDRPLKPQEQERLLVGMDRFLDEWTAHRAHLTAARNWEHDRFLMVGVDESGAGASGCSIDALVREIKRFEQELGVTLADRGPVLFREGDVITRVSRERFAELAGSGAVTLDTPVFDTTLEKVGDLRAGRWEVRARDAWHGRAFFSS